ncbi:MAG: glycerophosphodiester phosphodiesterase [Solidesulfovibrio sp. DCME]|uniref:glycerophosphodiester phosphodiesterase n=1 Tax=Solidesulfovibrio sp. DCME TaxID=3447380 RepID=UPI003D0C2F33
MPAPVKPIVIGHRGACGYLPEHTLASYERAIDLGADSIEPDLVATRDGVLIARHENNIAEITDVAAKFPQRQAVKHIDGRAVAGFFTEDLSLAEIKSLRARERLPFRDHGHDGLYAVPTFEEIIALVRRKQRETGRVIGIYPETKHPTYFRSIGLPLEEPLVAELRANGYDAPDAPVCIQSFELSNLRALRPLTKARLVFLYEAADKRPYDGVLSGDGRTYGDLLAPAALAEIAAFAQGIGPVKGLILPPNPDGSLGPATTLVADAHAAGLFVHPYTFRNEPRFLAPEYGGDPAKEYRRFFELGVDGLFSDFPDTAVAARDAFLANR